jgi:hypothetical protein
MLLRNVRWDYIPEGRTTEIKPVHTLPSYFLKTHFNIILRFTRVGLPRGLISSGFRTEILYVFLTCPMRVICPTNPNLLDLTVLIMFGDEYKL